MSGVDAIIERKVSKAIHTFGMISPGDRVLVAVSGGKDSTTLARFLERRRRGNFDHFEMAALHLHHEYCPCDRHPEIWELIEASGIELHRIDYSIEGRLKNGRRMNCYWCTTQRRTELLRFAESNGFTKIALGHHEDDIIETFFMNMVYQGELSTMLPVMRYDRYPQAVIRPLALVKESEIVEYAREIGIARIACSCGFSSRSKRDEVREHIERMCHGRPYLKDNILKSMSAPNLRYLMVDDRAPKYGL
jgi:tRNA 2-thiocytidine biosynthesis protein TtcA